MLEYDSIPDGPEGDAIWDELLARAWDLGKDEAANIYFNLDDDARQAVVDGENVPAVDSPLSGEWADGYGLSDLYADLGIDKDSDDAQLASEFETAIWEAIPRWAAEDGFTQSY